MHLAEKNKKLKVQNCHYVLSCQILKASSIYTMLPIQANLKEVAAFGRVNEQTSVEIWFLAVTQNIVQKLTSDTLDWLREILGLEWLIYWLLMTPYWLFYTMTILASFCKLEIEVGIFCFCLHVVIVICCSNLVIKLS